MTLWEKLQKLNPEANAATGALARVYTDRGEHAKAVKMYQLLAKAEPDNAELTQRLDAARQAAAEDDETTKAKRTKADKLEELGAIGDQIQKEQKAIEDAGKEEKTVE